VLCNRRAHDDIVSSLMQEKAYLEARIEPLQNQITELKESVHTQRIRALDLKHELNEVAVV
jgi:peptidoglycan hydrolase CwlO-like protein